MSSADTSPTATDTPTDDLRVAGMPTGTIAATAIQATLTRALQRHAGRPGGLLPILHDVQDALGHVPATAVPAIASALNLSRAEVHGVVTYYHHFRDHPPGRQVLQICRAEACQAMGADALVAHALQRLGCELHGTSADGAFTLEPVYCLGLCASSPALMLGDELHGRVTPQRLDGLLAEARRSQAESAA